MIQFSSKTAVPYINLRVIYCTEQIINIDMKSFDFITVP